MSDRAFSGRDVPDALAQAAHALGVAPAGLRYVVLHPGSPGGPGHTGTPAQIAVLLPSAGSGGAPSAEPRGRPRPPAEVVPASEARAANEARPEGVPGEIEALVATLARAAGLSLHAEVEERDESLHVFLRGDVTGFLLEEEGDDAAYRALDHLLQAIFARRLAPGRLRFECEGLREHREEALRKSALDLAAAVLRDGDPRTTGPLNSYERRIVHVTLAEEPRLTTYSVGDGKDRRVTVAPAEAPLGGEVH